MVNIEELWVGDLLKTKKSGRVGRYEGLNKEGKIRMSIGGKVLLLRPSQVEKADESDYYKKRVEIKEEDLAAKLGVEKASTSIDLHIEKLNPHLINALPERIADIQIAAFQKYIQNAVKDRLNVVTIIHGKGKGVLKTSIHTYLNSFEELNHFHLVNDGGATEVYFTY